MATPAPSLRPLSIGEILDAGIKVVLRNWKTLIGCTIVLMAPLSLFYVVAIASIDPEQLELIPETTTEPGELPEASEFIGYGVTFLIGAIALFVCYGTCFKAVSDAWLGKKPTVGESLRYGLRRAPRIFVLSVILVLFALVAWIPCFVPLIWLGVAWSLAIPAMLFEKAGSVQGARALVRADPEPLVGDARARCSSAACWCRSSAGSCSSRCR